MFTKKRDLDGYNWVELPSYVEDILDKHLKKRLEPNTIPLEMDFDWEIEISYLEEDVQTPEERHRWFIWEKWIHLRDEIYEKIYYKGLEIDFIRERLGLH